MASIDIKIAVVDNDGNATEHAEKWHDDELDVGALVEIHVPSCMRALGLFGMNEMFARMVMELDSEWSDNQDVSQAEQDFLYSAYKMLESIETYRKAKYSSQD